MHSMVSGPPSRTFLEQFEVIFFGGSGAFSVLDDVEWIRQGMTALTDVVDLGIPSWASCFGFQGLSLALGGEVIRDDEHTEMGSTWLRLTEAGKADPMVSIFPHAGFWAQEGHHDRVSRLPSGVTLLVEGDVVREQALKVDGAPFWASQFHPELSVQATLDRFVHYRDHYIDEGADEVFAMLKSGEDSREMAQLLPRLVAFAGRSQR